MRCVSDSLSNCPLWRFTSIHLVISLQLLLSSSVPLSTWDLFRQHSRKAFDVGPHMQRHTSAWVLLDQLHALEVLVSSRPVV